MSYTPDDDNITDQEERPISTPDEDVVVIDDSRYD